MDNSRSTQVRKSVHQKPLAEALNKPLAGALNKPLAEALNKPLANNDAANDHSMLAMRAAKQMRRSKHKVETGHTVCQHLLLMINEPDSQQPEPRASRRYQSLAAEHLVLGSEIGRNAERAVQRKAGRRIGMEDLFSAQAIQRPAANDRQFSLAF